EALDGLLERGGRLDRLGNCRRRGLGGDWGAGHLCAGSPRAPGRVGCGARGAPHNLSAMAPTHVELDRQRIQELTEREEQRLNESTQASQRMYERARNVLTGGVASSYQLREPGGS